MPEGPENHHSSNILHQELQGYTLNRLKYTDLFVKNKKYIDTDLVEESLPLTVKEISARGKRIVMILTDKEDEETAFVFFYAMTGSLSFIKGKYTQITYIFTKNDKEKRLYYEDKRTLGFVKYITTAEELYEIFKNIGPDFLRGEVSLELFTSIIKSDKLKNRKIGEVLMRQELFSGIGLYIKVEVLFDCSLSPHRLCSSLSDRRITKLYISIIKIITESYKAGGLTIENGDYRDPYGNTGNYEPKVYGKKNDPRVVREKDSTGRIIWWRPDKQK